MVLGLFWHQHGYDYKGQQKSLENLVLLTNHATPAYGVTYSEKRERVDGALHHAYPEMPTNNRLGFVYAK